eukprot:CAMPEP_0183330430 /NCGR_PEP_ID=MMETSP0160_2-20130417/85300_1 /TAXON_ID=2839 ORGANISM="Odontella Sinensis, Strain Grunow 1884" /NCGR_SAMPLE_ID=MMETSP0160_2 /ASSEMBLY_ACC=CAM_ASM_000250 /LENGTH=128 /DNA_ID=CAMNT_0025498639 /DNA_START=448 /DNA_END=830 /DNA_ORIENTATION=-
MTQMTGVLTVLYYLNGVGGTWFPLARRDEQEMNHNMMGPRTREEALALANECEPGINGLLLSGNSRNNYANRDGTVGIDAGDAIAFFNYHTDPETRQRRIDWRAIHSGLPTAKGEGNKWIANHWFHGG